MATLTTLAQYHMDYGDHMDNGWGWGMLVVMVLLVLAVILLAVWLARTVGLQQARTVTQSEQPPTAMQILDRRLASGEVTPDEYRERAAVLKG